MFLCEKYLWTYTFFLYFSFMKLKIGIIYYNVDFFCGFFVYG